MKIFKRTTNAVALAVLLVIAPFTQLSADERTPEEMLLIAESVFSNRIKEIRSVHGAEKEKSPLLAVTARTRDIVGESNMEVFNVYTFSDGSPGYVIVSADDRLPGVIGFSDNSSFSKENIPDALRETLACYTALLGSDYYTVSAAAVATENNSAVEPLLGEISYNQGAPFNDMCPLHEGKRSVTGCGATAMAEIMAFHRYPERMQGDVISYTTRTHAIPVTWDCAGTLFDWDNLLDKYTYGAKEYDKIESFTTNDAEFCVATGIVLSGYEDKIAVENLYNLTQEKLDLSVALILADTDGNLLYTISELKKQELAPQAMLSRVYFEQLITNEVEDGTYRIYVGLKDNATQEWTILQKSANNTDLLSRPYSDCYLALEKSGKGYTIDGKGYACAYSKRESDAVATLMAACGAASEMDYSNSSSGSFQIYQMRGWHKYMGYDDCMMYIDDAVFNEEGWHSRIQQELLEERPVYCAGYPEDGAGHAYVIDGFKYMDGIPYYHINWGWGGVSDGYFTITHMTPGSAGTGGDVTNYGYDVNLTVNIMPDDGKEAGCTLGLEQLSVDKSVTSPNEQLTVSVYKITNYTVARFEGDIVVFAVDDAGNEYELGNYFNGITMDFFLSMFDTQRTVEIPSGMPSGEYRIELRTVTKNSGTETTALVAEAPRVQINNTTSIEEIATENKSGEIYNIAGQKIEDADNNMIYIKNGKKHIKR